MRHETQQSIVLIRSLTQPTKALRALTNMSIPTELLTLMATSSFSAIMKLMGMAADSRRYERLYVLQALNASSSIIDEARRYENRGFQWTRRIIALCAVFFIIAFPKIVPLLKTGVTVYYGYPQASRGFLWFFQSIEKIQWVQMQGIGITPLDTHLLSAIIGLYFGGSLVSR